MYYREVNGKPVPATLEEFVAVYKMDRRVNRTAIGDVEVSTVFLGLDHAHDDGPPVLYETMIFGGKHDNDMWRYHTREEAEAGHAKVVAAVQAGKVEDLD